MGIIQSIICTFSFCVERILTWVCCATALIILLLVIVLLVIYGITIGYHYAQKELAAFAYNSRTTPGTRQYVGKPKHPHGPHYQYLPRRPYYYYIVETLPPYYDWWYRRKYEIPNHLLGSYAEFHKTTFPIRPRKIEDVEMTTIDRDLETYQSARKMGATGVNDVFWDTGVTEDTLSKAKQNARFAKYEDSTELSFHEHELVRKLLGRVRRSRNNNLKNMLNATKT